jgi:hypothetical protein
VTFGLTTNERGDPIISSLPVADLNDPPTGNQYLSQIVWGGGFNTQLVLINTASDPVTMPIDFNDDNGASVTSPFP